MSGIDPSQGQLDYARKRPVASLATFTLGDAMDLPFPDRSFDAAVMALVIFFVPDPARGVAEIEISSDSPAFTEQELELSVKHLSAGSRYFLFLDGQEVASFMTNHQGRAELEFTNKPLQ